MDFNFIPKVQAQGLDATAQPTFGPVDIEGLNPVNDSVQFKLTTETNTAKIGENFTVDVNINTGQDISISEYQIVIIYNPQEVTVVDQDTSTPGTQIQLVDSLFTVVEPIADNNYASTTAGKIYLRATGDFPIPVNYKVAEIVFQSQQIGNTEISLDTTPIEGTRVRRGNTDIAYTSSTLSVLVNETGDLECIIDADCPDGEVCLTDGTCGVPVITGCQTDEDCNEGEQCINNECVIIPECTTDIDCPGSQICINGQCEQPIIPETSLPGGVVLGINIFLAFLLIIFGLYLKSRANESKY